MIDKYRLDDLRLKSGEKGELARWVIQLQTNLDSERRKAGYSPAVPDGSLIGEGGIPEGWQLVPVEPTEDMIIHGFEAELREEFRDAEAWEAFEEMSGCEQAAQRARWCWAAMIAVAPKLNPTTSSEE